MDPLTDDNMGNPPSPHPHLRIRYYPEILPRESYSVYIEAPTSNLPIVSLSKSLRHTFPDLDNVFYINKRKLHLTTKCRRTANNIAADTELNKLYKVYIPAKLVEVTGVAPIPAELNLSDEELLTYAKPFYKKGPQPLTPLKIIEARRFKKKTETGLVSLDLVSFTFEGMILPPYVTYDNIIFPISPKRPTIMQCRRCHKFGHTAQRCRSAPKCVHCGKSKDENHPSPCTDTPRCSNCSQEHEALDRSCPVYLERKKMQISKSNPKVNPFSPFNTHLNIFSQKEYPLLPIPRSARQGKTLETLQHSQPIKRTTTPPFPQLPISTSQSAVCTEESPLPKKATKRKIGKFENPIKLCLDILENNFKTNPINLDEETTKLLPILGEKVTILQTSPKPLTSEDSLPRPGEPSSLQKDI